MNSDKPTLDEWRALYQAAREFKKLACWNWMADSDVFGVQNSETGEIGYCSVMGANGEHFALGVYNGAEGLNGFFMVQNELISSPLEAVCHQSCLMASFEDRSLIPEEDYRILRELGHRFRGKNAWPLFRDFTPGYFPWHIRSSDCRFLTLALEQACHVGKRLKRNPELLSTDEDFVFLTRVPSKQGDGLIWRDELIESPDLEVAVVDVVELTDLVDRHGELLEELKTKKQEDAIWEIGSHYLPEPVQDHETERPYYPRSYLVLDQATGLVLVTQLARKEDFPGMFCSTFLELLEQVEILPGKIHAMEIDILNTLLPLGEILGIEIHQAVELRVFEEAKASMSDFYLGDQSFEELLELVGLEDVDLEDLDELESIRSALLNQGGIKIDTKGPSQKRGKGRPSGGSGSSGARCGLCGKKGKLRRTECCGQLVCDDHDQYVMFSYAHNSCSRNHERYTLCASHHNEGHEGDWKDCEKCRNAFETEIYVWYGTNEYNFEKLKNPPKYKPTRCAGCRKIIKLGEDGYALSGDKYWCMNCHGDDK